MKPAGPGLQSIPLDIVGSNQFGRYPKISYEQTINMIVSDDALVPYAGYVLVASLYNERIGRGLFSSINGNKMIAVVGERVFAIDVNLNPTLVGTLSTSSGAVSIDENNAQQIAICDQSNIYIYNYLTGAFGKATLPFIPGYVAFQDGYFIAPGLDTNRWYLSAPNNGLVWTAAPATVGLFQTKPDTPVAIVRQPGREGRIFVIGNNTTESWYDTAYTLFPYQRDLNYIDYGTANAATVAFTENFVCWVSQNEKSGPAIVYSNGGPVTKISTDGIDYLLAQLNFPGNSFGFFFRQDGHVIYQVTWPTDNLSLAYDFNTGRFYTLTDINGNYHIAQKLVYFNDTYYFVSAVDGNLYEMTTQQLTYNGNEIPRTRVCKPIALPDRSPFVINSFTFPLEMGQPSTPQAAFLSLSFDGGQSFGGSIQYPLNAQGLAQNRVTWWQCGYGNEVMPQFRWYGNSRFVAKNGEVTIYQ